MGGSGGMFGRPKQKAASGFQISEEARAAEMEAINRQRAIASGAAPSIAQMQFKNNLDQTSQQAMALAASQRGASNPALAFRQAQISNQQAGLEGAQQAAILAEQERRAADEFLARQAAAQRGVALQSAVANQNSDAQKSAADKQMFAGLAGTAGKLLSDKDAKENVKPQENVGEAIQKFIEAIKPYNYEYKKSEHGTGKKIGVMAQDLEKTEVGKTMVDEAADGTKVVDTNKAIGVILAGMSDLNKKLKKLEK